MPLSDFIDFIDKINEETRSGGGANVIGLLKYENMPTTLAILVLCINPTKQLNHQAKMWNRLIVCE